METNYLPLSVVMITYNAAESLLRSLQSVSALADEVIIVDSGSQDDTREIAQRFGATVVHQDWLGFGLQKQLAVQLARHDWVLCLDADEWLSNALIDSIKRVLCHPRHYVYMMPRRNRFLGRFLRHGEAYPDENIRLFNRQYANWTDHSVHEYVQTRHSVCKLTGDLFHDSAESLHRYLEKQNDYTTLQAKQLIEARKKVSVTKAIFSSSFRFIKGYFFRLGFLDGFAGLVHITIAASNSFFKYTKAIVYRKNNEDDTNSKNRLG